MKRKSSRQSSCSGLLRGGKILVEIAYSGGKDSDVILQLAKEAKIPYRAIYKNTTIDPPGTIKHVRDMGVEVLMPKKNFFQLIEDNGFPTMFHRFCCNYLKEYKVLDKAVVGVRRSESTRRANRYQEPSACRWYGSKSKPENHVEQIYPLLDWTDADVEEYLKERGVRCASLYYDKDGSFHVERRLGCMCCPMMYYKKRIEAFKQYPNMVKGYLKAGQKFRDKHPDTKTAKKYSNVYEHFMRNVFFDSPKAWQEFKEENLFGEFDYKAFLEDYFHIKLD